VVKSSVVMLVVGASLAFPLFLFLKITISSESYDPDFFDVLAVVMSSLFPTAHLFWQTWAAKKRDIRIRELEIENKVLDAYSG
jgi:hypothetical protein